MKDYYELLEVNKNASEETIKKVFRMLIKKNHPDLFEGEEKQKAEEKSKELNEAYEILINKDKRDKYDLEFEEYNSKKENSVEILIQENEYLKNVIYEKDKIIKEFLNDMDVNVKDFNNEIEYNNYDNEENRDEYSDYEQVNGKLTNKEIFKNFIYMVLIIVIGSIILKTIAGIDVFKILVEIFKSMF